MSSAPKTPSPSDIHVPAPTGAAAIGDWCDLEYGADASRNVAWPRRGVGAHYVEATGVQFIDGTLEEVCVRAEIDLWGLNTYAAWDDMLSADEARAKAAELCTAAQKLLALASAFISAADEADAWTAVTAGAER